MYEPTRLSGALSGGVSLKRLASNWVRQFKQRDSSHALIFRLAGMGHKRLLTLILA